MTEGAVDVFVAVGSNIDPERHILEALGRVKQYGRVTGVSTFYRTEPVGRPEQQSFLNGVWRIETSTSARVLKFDCLRVIEADLGRVRTADKWASRTIDLDIILYGDAVIDEPGLRIPDPEIRVRSFIAIPLLELAPDLVLPDTKECLASVVDHNSSLALRAMRGFTRRLREQAFDDRKPRA